MTSLTRCALLLALILFLSPPRPCGAGQTNDEPGANARVRLGAAHFTPTIQVNAGFDSNIFNSSDQQVADFVRTVSPKTQGWMRLGPARLSGTGAVDIVSFQTVSSESSVNLDGSVRLAIPLHRLEPYISTSILRSRERPSLEIDARSLRRENGTSVGTVARVSGKTDVEFNARMSSVRFDTNAVFLQTSLSDVLNRDAATLDMSLRHRLTPLTTLTVSVDTTSERFVRAPDRDARTTRVLPGVEFGASALVSGKASVGYEAFAARGSSIPEFRGLVAAVNLAYTMLGATQFTFQANRNVEPSFEVEAPYYVLSQLSGAVVRRVSDTVGITARYGRSRLTYDSATTVASDAASRVDTVVLYGGGAILKMGRDLRFTVNVDYYRRHSVVVWREFNSLQAGGAIIWMLD